MNIDLLDLIDKLQLDQKTINDLNANKIFYVYELLTINPKTSFAQLKSMKHCLTNYQRNLIEEKVHSNNFKFLVECSEKEQQSYYDYINSILQEKHTEEIENMDLDCLNFPHRIRNCLLRSGYDTLFKIAKMSILDLKQIRNLGTSSIELVLNKLHSLGIYLHGEDISKIKKITTVKTTIENLEENSLFLIEQAKEKIKNRKNKTELLRLIKDVNRIIEISDAKEKETKNELISYIYMILDVLKDDSNKEKIEQVESILKTLYIIDVDEDIKILKKEK